MVRLLSGGSEHAPTLRERNQVTTIETPHGVVEIHPRRPPGTFSALRLDSGIGHFAHYSSIIQKLDVFDKIAASQDGRVTLAVMNDEIVVGYVTGTYPDHGERWSKLGDLMYELSTIELSRNFRGSGLASKLVSAFIGDDFFEDRIAYMNGFSWHWDIDGSGLTLPQYRKLMIRLLKPFGFQECYTNEPNIAIREENVFMARIGSRVTEDAQKRFRNLRFGIVDRS
jgi:acetoin utilization protein AcuA